MTLKQHLVLTCGDQLSDVAWASKDMDLAVGRFSGAETDCAKHLNGFKVGSRYDGTFKNTTPMGSCDQKQSLKMMSDAAKEEVKEFISAQLEAYSASGTRWLFWAGKAEKTADL
ncbi:hypothetical protein BCR37DRAFT_385835 [Protomyces lactucae-debilis]|uniref:Uncharacterized protein n=1 Tax=Protomyces lactucae-debilis TaxID=2754530 RepID=A0A1Y2FSV1_PROLT|nr:uncharacterized protein BCR37DRAFT_385835 [Protomyces lactucae-debilis]ORY86394.1 hypothetical protein BCR37DRAFT_385835 [Protomyces lactucae-debilis]